MIKISEKLWYAISKWKDSNMAYLTYYEENKAFEKRQQTGLRWSGQKEGIVAENTPLQDFFVAGFSSWHRTNNKFVRISDPRGFIVETPVENFVDMLQRVSLKDGIIQDRCVWGRESGNLVLVPIGTDMYENAEFDDKKNKPVFIKTSQIYAGSKVEMMDGSEYTYIGRAKIKYKVTPYTYNATGWSSRKKVTKGSYDWENPNYTNIFENRWGMKSIPSPKITKILSQGSGEEYTGDINISAPGKCCDDWYYDSEVLCVTWRNYKGGKS
jgi:hypothetical protein